MKDVLIAAGFVLIALIASLVIGALKRRKEAKQVDDLFSPRPSTSIVTSPATRRFDCPYEEIDLTVADHVQWLKSENDPELWHVACQAALAYTDDPHRFVPWVVEQSELDRSTGGWIFFWLEGSRYLEGQDTFYHSYSSDSYILDVLQRLTKRSETVGFHNNEIGLDQEFDIERQNCLSLIAEGRVATGRIIPHSLIQKPYFPPKAIAVIDNIEGVVCL